MILKGEAGEGQAATLASVSLKSLRGIDGEFHAKLDLDRSPRPYREWARATAPRRSGNAVSS